MQRNIIGIPASIEVEGQQWRVRFTQWDKFEANTKGDNWVQSETFEGLRELIQKFLVEAEADRQRLAIERANRTPAARKPKTPVVWALYGTRHEKVKIRGKSAKGGRTDVKLLVTRADGRNVTMDQDDLMPLTLDVEAVTALKAQRDALNGQMKKFRDSTFESYIRGSLRGQTITVEYNPETAKFTATWGEDADAIVVTGTKPRKLTEQVEIMALAKLLPWTIDIRSDDEKVIRTSSLTEKPYGWTKGFKSKEEAEEFLRLDAEYNAVSKAIREAEEFDYDAEVAKVTAALRVVNGEA